MREYEGTIVENFEDCCDYFLNVKPSSFRIVARFTDDLDIEYLFKLCFVVGNLVLVVEEAEIYISPFAKSTSFLRLVRYGRHRNIRIIGVARRVSELSVDFRAQVNTIISFKQTEPRDLAIMQELGFTGLENLNNYQFIEKSF